jgi:squalene-hopene/tetraprenyl-beta-curcumene cyclase
MGLCTLGDPHRPSLVRGIEYLTRTQNLDGSWAEEETTGTGFPKVYYLKYDMYRNSWPLLAFATYRKLLEARAGRPVDGARQLRVPSGFVSPAAIAPTPTVATA